ncbi:MAG: hypothetical protein ACK5RJ_09340 [Burkholderiales bacterium]|jgi:hypothetical protein|nr:hypothetical protein [Rhodocyclaceae bacterium]MCA3020935.1 hypothetical protein [Rhodocyclaceae bacterium]MCA3044464.1 hypothetical protein [Rhodocyclaceae bacterium]MCA3053083.1 hypothetical protein [Rhodocyclaceae bacterium]MCA3057022.1 hypothetical protein [Rhodocyclaceae bacterium]
MSSLEISLLVVFLAFCVIMGAVLTFCIRERRLVDGLSDVAPMSAEAIENEDIRLVKVLFGAIIAGALLALITGYLVFMRDWN